VLPSPQILGTLYQAAGSRQQAAGSRQQAAGSRQQAAGSGQLFCHVELVETKARASKR